LETEVLFQFLESIYLFEQCAQGNAADVYTKNYKNLDGNENADTKDAFSTFNLLSISEEPVSTNILKFTHSVLTLIS
jgi:hypothetical protein